MSIITACARSGRCECDGHARGDHVRALRSDADPRAAHEVPRLRGLKPLPAVFQLDHHWTSTSFQQDQPSRSVRQLIPSFIGHYHRR